MGEDKQRQANGGPTDSGDGGGGGAVMKRNLGLVSGVAMMAGTMIGSGIFISPIGVLRVTGSVGACLIVWVGCGVISMLGALSYAELGTMIGKSGGEYAYLYQGFSRYGRFVGFAPAYSYIWTMMVVIKPSSLAVITMIASTYIVQPFFGACTPPPIAVKLLSAVLILSITTLNILSARVAARIQNFFFAAKMLALTMIIVGGMVKLAYGATKHISSGFEGTTSEPSELALAFYYGLFAYDGWNNLNMVTEEIKRPERNLPLAIICAVPVVMCLYVLTIISYFTVLSKEEFLLTEAVAVSWGQKVLGDFVWIIPLSVVLSALGAANGSVFTCGRLAFAAARDNQMPQLLAMIHYRKFTPIPCLVINAVISIVMLIPGDIFSLMDFFSFSTWVFYGLTMIALLVMRRTFPNAKRAYKVPIVIPILVLCISIFLVIGPIVRDPDVGFLYAVLFILAGLVPYVPLVYMDLKLPGIDRLTKYLQVLMQIVPSEYKKELLEASEHREKF